MLSSFLAAQYKAPLATPVWQPGSLLQIAQHLVDVVCRGKFFFQLALPLMIAEMLDGLREAVQRRLQIIRVRKDDVPPNCVGTARQAQGIAQSAARQRERQPRLVGRLAD